MFSNRFENLISLKDLLIHRKLRQSFYFAKNLLKNIDGKGETFEGLLAKRGEYDELEDFWADDTKNIQASLAEVNHQRGFINSIIYDHPRIANLYLLKGFAKFASPQHKATLLGDISLFEKILKLDSPTMREYVQKWFAQKDELGNSILTYAIAGNRPEIISLIIKHASHLIDFLDICRILLITRKTHLASLFMNKMVEACKTEPMLFAKLFSVNHSLKVLYTARRYCEDPGESIKQLIYGVANNEWRTSWITSLHAMASVNGLSYLMRPTMRAFFDNNDSPTEMKDIAALLKENYVNQSYEVDTVKITVEIFMSDFERSPAMYFQLVKYLLIDMRDNKADNVRIIDALVNLAPEKLKEVAIQEECFDAEDHLTVKTIYHYEPEYELSGIDLAQEMMELSREQAPFDEFESILNGYEDLLESGLATEQDYSYAIYPAFVLGRYDLVKEWYESSSLWRKYDGTINDAFTYLNRFLMVLFTELQFDVMPNYKEHLKDNFSTFLKIDPNQFSLLLDSLIFANFNLKDKSCKKLYDRIGQIPYPKFKNITGTNTESYEYVVNTLMHSILDIYTKFIVLNSSNELRVKDYFRSKNANLANESDLDKYNNLLLALDNSRIIKAIMRNLLKIFDDINKNVKERDGYSVNFEMLSSDLNQEIKQLDDFFESTMKAAKKDEQKRFEVANKERKLEKDLRLQEQERLAKEKAEENERLEKIREQEVLKAQEEKQKEIKKAKQDERRKLKKQEKSKKAAEKRAEKLAKIAEIPAVMASIGTLESELSELKLQREKLITEELQLIKDEADLNRQYNDAMSNVNVNEILLKQLEEETNKLLTDIVLEYGLPKSSAKLFQQFEGKIYLTGGAVRDIELKLKNPSDYDYVAFATVKEIIALYPDAEVKGEGDFSTVTVTIDGIKHDIALLKEEPGQSHEVTLARNSCKRDFTINSKYVSFSRKGIKVFHPWDGDLHKQNGIIEFVNPEFSQDVFFIRPERYFRLINLNSVLKFKYSDNVMREVAAIKSQYKRFASACLKSKSRIERQYSRLAERYQSKELYQFLLDNQLLYPLLVADILPKYEIHTQLIKLYKGSKVAKYLLSCSGFRLNIDAAIACGRFDNIATELKEFVTFFGKRAAYAMLVDLQLMDKFLLHNLINPYAEYAQNTIEFGAGYANFLLEQYYRLHHHRASLLSSQVEQPVAPAPTVTSSSVGLGFFPPLSMESQASNPKTKHKHPTKKQ